MTVTTAAKVLLELIIHAVYHVLVAFVVTGSAEGVVCVYAIVATVVGKAVSFLGVFLFHVNVHWVVVFIDAGEVLVVVGSRQGVQRRAQVGLLIVCIFFFLEVFQLLFDLVALLHDGAHVSGKLLEESSLFSHDRDSFLDEVAVGIHAVFQRVVGSLGDLYCSQSTNDEGKWIDAEGAGCYQSLGWAASLYLSIGWASQAMVHDAAVSSMGTIPLT